MEPSENFIFTPIEDGGLIKIFSIYPRETKKLSARDKIICGNCKLNLFHEHLRGCMGFLPGRLDKIHIQFWVILVQDN